MADDERRAEIEAATDALLEDSGLPRYGGHRATIERRMTIAFDAVDRVRDARGDDEHHPYADLPADLLVALRDPDTKLNDLGVYERVATWVAARSPQGEDHEAVEAALDAIEGYAQALTDQRGWGATRRAICENAQKVRTYLSRVPPSRGGTVAVEQPEPDALGGLPPSQPKEDNKR